MDLSAQFYLTEDHVRAGVPRAQASLSQLGQLNPYVKVSVLEGVLETHALDPFQVVIACDTGGVVAEKLDAYCHANGKGFIFGECRGPFSRLFVDFGPSFSIRDTDGRAKEEYDITGISNTNPAIVTVVSSIEKEDDRPLQRYIDDGNEVELREVQGATEANSIKAAVKLLTKRSLELVGVDARNWGRYVTGGVLREVKKSKVVSFKPLSESRKAPGEFQMVDFAKWGRAEQMHALFQALDEMPSLPTGESAGPTLAALAARYSVDPETPVDAALASQVAALCRGTLAPMCAFLGGVIAQEALKYTGKFTPCMQWAYVDCLEVVPDPLPLDRAPREDRYDGQRWVFGDAWQTKFGSLKAFMVGAGALGCELLKGLAGMGVCLEQQGGSLAVTDMDSIEKSNLNRQFLFRDTDLGQPKSAVACRAVKVMNPHLNLVHHNIPVGVETETTFDHTFWSGLDVAINALDTWSARLYVDSRCVEFRKPLLESGTLGASGHTQVIIPNLTLNFGATRLQKETTVPQCTIHMFPTSIQHTLMWAREQFDTLFVSTAEDLNRHTLDPMYLSQLLQRMPAAGKLEVLRRLLRVKALAQKKPTLVDCVQEARCMFEDWFNTSIKQILKEYPADALNEDGGPFWAPPKRPPVPLDFDFANATHLSFLISTASLLAARHGIPGTIDRPLVLTALGDDARVSFPHLSSSAASSTTTTTSTTGDEREVAALGAELGIGSIGNDNNAVLFNLFPAKFEKDDDSNHHVDFLYMVGNLRASMYGITPIDRLEAKKIVGKIIPAMVTTTCSITGLVLMQLYHLMQRRTNLELYKESNLDFAQNILGLGEPEACKKNGSTPKYRCVPEGWTLWDTLDIRQGDCTVAKVATHLAKEYGVALKGITCEGMPLYQERDKANRETRAKQKLSEIYCQLKHIDSIPLHKYRLVLALLCLDKATGVEIEFPTVGFYFREARVAEAASEGASKKDKKKKEKKKRKTEVK